MKVLLIALLLFAPGLQAQVHTGTLEASDPLLDGSRHYDSYPITVEMQQQVTVRMTSQEFDTYLIVRGPDGAEFINDDFESMSVSQVDFVAPAAGEWTVMASGFGTDALGSYELEITLGGVGQIETIAGRLDPSDPMALKGEYYDEHSIEVGDDGEFVLELEAYGFDGYLVAESPSGERWRNDDADRVSLSRIGPLSGMGTWTVYVTTSFEEQVGAYDLRIIRFPQ